MQNAPLYATSNAMQRRDAAVVLASHLPSMTWQDGENILDVGSGSGDVTSGLLYEAIPVDCSLVGCDVSKEMVSYATEHHSADNIKFVQLDITAASCPRSVFPAGFQKVLSLYCLHWVRDLPAAVRNIFSLLVSGGQSLLIFLASNPIFRVYRLLASTTKWSPYMKVGPGGRTQYRELTRDLQDVETFVPVYQDSTHPGQEFAALLARTGFSVRKCEAVDFSYTFTNKNQLRAALKAVNPFLVRIPEAKHSEFLSDCVSCLLSLVSPGDPNKLEAKYRLLVAHMSKK